MGHEKRKKNPFVQYYTKFEQNTTTATSIFKRMFHKSLFEISLPTNFMHQAQKVKPDFENKENPFQII